MLRSVALGGALVCAVGGTAFAADFGGAFPDPVPPGHHHKVHDWSGMYAGVHAGYGWGNWDIDLSISSGAIHYNDPFDPDQVTLDGGDGWLGGFQVGANHQMGSALIGIEADAALTGMSASGRYTTVDPNYATWDIESRLHAFGTVRGRIGVVHGPVLLYGTGGLAWGITDTTQETNWFQALGAPSDDVGGRTSGTNNHIGYSLGAGMEWMFAKNWTLRAQYLFADLGKVNYALAGTQKPTNDIPYVETFGTDIKLHSATIGINYLFGNN